MREEMITKEVEKNMATISNSMDGDAYVFISQELGNLWFDFTEMLITFKILKATLDEAEKENPEVWEEMIAYDEEAEEIYYLFEELANKYKY